MDSSEKVLENKLRRQAKRLGYVLKKSRAKCISINNLGEYMIVDSFGNYVVAGENFDYSLNDVEEFLNAREEELSKRQRK